MFRRGSRRRRSGGLGSIVDSMKNETNEIVGITAATNQFFVIANAVDSALLANASDVERGCKIFRIYLEFWYYGLSAGNTNDIMDVYLIKNPGSNLTLPNPGTIGTSNEKKFVFKEWKGLAGNKSLGGGPYQFRGWIKVPKHYQRMGSNDQIVLVTRSPTTGNVCHKAIYKWFK